MFVHDGYANMFDWCLFIQYVGDCYVTSLLIVCMYICETVIRQCAFYLGASICLCRFQWNQCDMVNNDQCS